MFRFMLTTYLHSTLQHCDLLKKHFEANNLDQLTINKSNNEAFQLHCGPEKHLCHQDRSYLLLLCSIGYNVIKWSNCDVKRDLLYFFNICNNIIFVTYKCQF